MSNRDIRGIAGLALVFAALVWLAGVSARAEGAVTLAGEWRFALDRADEGVGGRWFARDLEGRIRLPGVLQSQGFGDEISAQTPWVLSLYDRYWFMREDYKAYTRPGAVKVPFLSQPPRHYVGAAWYQREIEVPRGWEVRHAVLFLERPRWESTVWVGERRVGSNNSLVAPHVYDLGPLVRRDRNHPSVILRSTGNEIGEQGNAEGHRLSRRLTDIVHEEDPTRPVTAGANHVGAGYNGFQNTVDVFGYNYKPGEYAKFRERNPAAPLYGSETSSTVSSRGEYFFPVEEDKDKGRADFQVSSYDLYAPRWATTPDAEFRAQDEHPEVAGEFVWTGFDYLGEPTPYNADASNLLNFTDPAARARMEAELQALGRIRVPSRSSYFGIIDLAGFPKDRFYIYQARWRPDLPVAHLLPHWNWPGREGQPVPVHVYTSGDEAELFLNGRSLGRRRRGRFEYRLRWDDVRYEPGKLRVVAYRGGRRWASGVTKTTGAAAQLSLKPDRARIRADGRDLSFITVSIRDAAGLVVPRSKNRVRFELSGPGEIVATDNGDATSFESFQSKERNAYNGLCLVVVRAKAPGAITLRAHAEGLKGALAVIRGERGRLR